MWELIIDSTFFSVLYLLILAGSIVVGYYMAYWFYRRRNRTWQQSSVESSLIGFFALVISFTLSSAYSSLKERSRLIHDQADVLAQMNREALLLPASMEKKVKQYLRGHISRQMFFYENRIKKIRLYSL